MPSVGFIAETTNVSRNTPSLLDGAGTVRLHSSRSPTARGSMSRPSPGRVAPFSSLPVNPSAFHASNAFLRSFTSAKFTAKAFPFGSSRNRSPSTARRVTTSHCATASDASGSPSAPVSKPATVPSPGNPIAKSTCNPVTSRSDDDSSRRLSRRVPPTTRALCFSATHVTSAFRSASAGCGRPLGGISPAATF